MAKEYKTTVGDYHVGTPNGAKCIDVCDDPNVPEGDGWRMVGSVVVAETSQIIWFWERELTGMVKSPINGIGW